MSDGWISQNLDALLSGGSTLLPTFATLMVALFVYFGAKRVLDWRGQRVDSQSAVGRQLALLALGLIGFVAVVLSLPIDPSDRRQLLSLIGLLLSGAIALSATTFLGNIMAGLQLSSLSHMRAGDLIEVEGVWGRVTKRGLLQVEVQTEDRDLTTFPNLFLASHPVRVMQSSGTIVSSTLSLGYDVPRSTVTTLLTEAAAEAGLEEPFVRVLELGDFAVTYRVAGLLKDVSTILTARSRLNAKVADALHGAGIEIASPNLMLTRQLDASHRLIPPISPPAVGEDLDAEARADRMAFDKADSAALQEQLEQLRERLVKRLEELSSEEGEEAEREIARTRTYLERVDLALEHNGESEDA